MKALLLLALCALVVGCATTRPPLPARAIQLNDRGAAALGDGDLDAAEAQIALALEYNPRFTEAWVNLGLVELRRGRLDKARHDLRHARSLNPDLPAPHHGLGLVAEKAGDTRAAEKHYREALKVDPGFAPARVNLGRLLFARGAIDPAREQFLRLTQVAPERVEGWAGLTECLLRLGRDADADATLDRGRQLLGERPELLLLVGRRLLRAGDHTRALSTLRPLAESSDPSLAAAAWAWIAVDRIAEGDATAGTDAAHRSLALQPGNAVARYALAQAGRR